MKRIFFNLNILLLLLSRNLFRISMKKYFFKSLVSLCLVLGFTSCYNDIDLFNISDEVKLGQALIIPIGSSEATAKDILSKLGTNQYLILDSTSNEIMFEKFDTINYAYKNFDILHNISPLSEDFVFQTSALPVTIPANATGTLSKNTQFSTTINTDVTKERLDSIVLNSVTFTCKLSELNFPIAASNVKVKVTFPTQNVKLFNSPGNSVTFSPTAYNIDNNITLNNVTLFFPSSTTDIPLQVEVTYTNGSTPVMFLLGARCITEFSFKTADYKIAYGYFEPSQYINQAEKKQLDYFGYMPNGNLRFANPQLFIKVKHNVGTHLKFVFDYVRAYLSTDPINTSVYASFDGSSSFSQTLDKPASVGAFATTQLRAFDKDFGQTHLLFENPQQHDVFEYQLSSGLDNAKINADHTPNYLIPNSEINIYMHSQIALYFNEGTFYEQNDTTELNGEIDAQLDGDIKIDTCYLVLNFTNGFPCQASVSLTLYDDYGARIPSTLEKTYAVKSAHVDADGTVQSGGENKQIIKIAVNQANIEELKQAKFLVTKLKVTGEDGELSDKKIHITQDNFIKAQVGLYIKLNSTVHLTK